jgi:Mobilization protein NikA
MDQHGKMPTMITTVVEMNQAAGNNPGVAGKPKPKAELKDHVVQVRLTKAQYRAFAAAARNAGHSLSAWLRALGIRESRQIAESQKEPD